MKSLFIAGLIQFSLLATSTAQIVCIECFNQNEPISPGATNLILNGGFEATDCTPGWLDGSWCPSSNLYNCDIESWRCVGGGVNSYPVIFDTTLSLVPEGQYAAYFGNGNAFMCMPFSFDTSCIQRDNCTVSGFPPGFPTTLDGYGGPDGVSLEQTIDNLVGDESYVLEFWAGGEPLQELLLEDGVFAVDVGFGKTYLTSRPTTHNSGDVGTVFLIRFIASSPTHTITFTNWGHMCSDCTELVLDNVRLYTEAELSAEIGECTTSVEGQADDDQSILYPNPADDMIFIGDIENEDYDVMLFDANGRAMDVMLQGNSMDIGSLAKGIYILILHNGHKEIVKRIVRL